jgi:aminopeptidase
MPHADIWDQYAELLIDYCLEIKKGDRLLIKTTMLAEPLVRALYGKCLSAGGHPHVLFSFSEQMKLYTDLAEDHQLEYVSPFYEKAIQDFEAYLLVRAPYNLRETNGGEAKKRELRAKAMEPINKMYFKRTADRSLKRSLCQFPTQASAQMAGMALSDYEQFVFKACQLDQPDPKAAWLNVRHKQQRIVDYLNQCEQIRYLNARSDIRFSVKNRQWINSDGRTNMPSGEIYTSPVENSVEGHIHFDLPTVFRGHRVRGCTLHVKKGLIEDWSAEEGQEFLNEIFTLPGARRFGEAAIGTNYNIDQTTGNILFDEKIGGTIHMAIGQSYLQAGGKNSSPVHWDMIANMRDQGEIYADDTCIYKNSKFSI